MNFQINEFQTLLLFFWNKILNYGLPRTQKFQKYP